MGQIKYKKVGGVYVCTERFVYYSKRYNRSVTVEKGFPSDGATGAIDIGALYKTGARHKKTAAWFVHDKICVTGKWDDGTLIDNWTASTIIGDILWADNYKIRAVVWWWMTYLFGGGAARENGMRRVNLI